MTLSSRIREEDLEPFNLVASNVRARLNCHARLESSSTLIKQISALQELKTLDNPQSPTDAGLNQVKTEIQNLISGNTPKDVSILAEIAENH
jgi:hypothetical protein